MTALHYPIAVLMFVIGLYCLVFRRNLIKMVIGLGILTNGVHLLLVSIGYRLEGVAPILTGDLLQFAASPVDPLPQVLVLTSIVIDISIVALALSLIIYIYREHKTLNPDEIRELKG